MALNNLPLPGQNLLVTRDPINQNFSVIDTAFSVDHVPYNNGGQGKHNKVTFPVQAGTPAFNAGEEGLYNKQLSAVSELYVHKQSAAGVQEIPMTNSTLSTSTPASGTGGFTYLPSGFYMTFGQNNANGPATITLANPPPNQILNVMLCPFSGAAGYQNIEIRLVAILNRTQFNVWGSLNGVASPVGFSFIVTGY